MGQIICIANRKGGVGKTTTAINLSASLAIAGFKTLVIDCDPQGNATSGLGIRDTESRPTLYQLLLGECSHEEAIRETTLSNLELIPSNQDLIGAEVELLQNESREYILRETIRRCGAKYKYIILDCPPSLGLLTLNSLAAATSVLIPVQCEYYALEGLKSVLETLDIVKQNLNPGLRIEGFLLTMFDPRNRLCHQVAEEIRDYFRTDVFEAVIPRNVRLSECPSHGLPIILYDPSCRGAKSYSALAAEIANKETGIGFDRISSANTKGGGEL